MEPLFAASLVQALLKKADAITRGYLRFVRFVRAVELLELFGSSFFCSSAILGGDLVGIDQFLRYAGLTA